MGASIPVRSIRSAVYGDTTEETWELTTRRVITLINDWRAAAGSDERVHVLGGPGGHDGVFVLLTPAMRHAIPRSSQRQGAW
jgi:hypothetical protein